MNDKKIIRILTVLTIMGVCATFSLADKVVLYRKNWQKSNNACSTVTKLMLEAEKSITDPEKLKEFRKLKKLLIEQTGDTNKSL